LVVQTVAALPEFWSCLAAGMGITTLLRYLADPQALEKHTDGS
jgi:hypothetical protein